MDRIRNLFATFYRYLREVSGDSDYERYHQQALARGETPQAPRPFYLEKLRRKYSGISRCC